MMDLKDHISKVAIIGAGTMGQGIAQVCATAGFDVLLFDISAEAVAKAISEISLSTSKLVERNKITARERDTLIERIRTTSIIEDVVADLIVEAVVERIDVKQRLFTKLESINADSTIFSSNTSSLSITNIASVLRNPSRMGGLHFFNPAPLMKLVEVVKGSATDDVTVGRLQQFAKQLGKHTVLTKDAPGFIVNRVARHYYVESLKVVEENVCDYVGVDALMRAVGFKMGPFELMDLIGIDINFSVTSSLYNSFHHDPKFRPSRIQQQKVDAGFLGRKAGKGFYDYS